MNAKQTHEPVQADAAVVQATSQPTNDKAKHGKRLTQQQIAVILQLSNSGQTQSQIAAQIGVNPSTVFRTLEMFSDGRELARKRLEGGALKLAATVVNTKDSYVALKALGKLDVVREDQASGGNSLVVVLGSETHPLMPPALTIEAKDPFRPSLSPVIEGESLTVSD